MDTMEIIVLVSLLGMIVSSEALMRRGSGSCINMSMADGFLSSETADNDNGKRVGGWRESHPEWPFSVKKGEFSCMLQGQKPDSSQPGPEVVVDFRSKQENIDCCQTGANYSMEDRSAFELNLANNNIDFKTFNYSIPEGENHTAKNWGYQLAIPSSCQPGQKNAPCPLLVIYYGMGGDGAHFALECTSCLEEMGVVFLRPRIPKADRSIIDRGLWVAETFVRKFTQETIQSYPDHIDSDRVYMFGNSIGGSAAFMTAITNPDIFRAAYVVSPKTEVKIEEGNLRTDATRIWKPLYDNRKGQLQQLHIYLGGFDGGSDINWDLLPSTVENLGLHQDLHVEYHVFSFQPHDCWYGAFNMLRRRLWNGEA